MVASYQSDWAVPDPNQQAWWSSGDLFSPYMYGQRQSSVSGYNYQPSPWGQNFDPSSSYTLNIITDQIQQGLRESNPELYEFFTTAGGGYIGDTGDVASNHPNFPNFTTQQDAEIQAAAQQFGIPPNFLKAIINRESSGDWASNNRFWYGRPQSGPLLPYVGVFLDAATSRTGMSEAQFMALAGNRAGQTNLLAQVLRSQYDQLRKQNPDYGWENVASYHFSGNPVPTGWADELGMTDTGYTQRFMNEWRMLDSFAGNEPGGFDPGPLGEGDNLTQVNAIWGGAPLDLSQGIESSGFTRSRDWYLYGRAYGLDGYTHTGLDQRMPAGTRLYSPVGGVVTVTDPYNGFSDERYPGAPQTGQLRILMDDGTEIILGHMGGIHVQVGQRINPGDYVGLSGTYNGDHLHLEARVPDPTMPGGMRIVDPREVLSGNFFGSFSQGQSGAGVSRPYTYNDLMLAAAQGKPIYGGATQYSSGSGWNDWLYNQLFGGGSFTQAEQQYNADPWAAYRQTVGPPSGSGFIEA